MKKLIMLGIIFIFLGCKKEISFENIQNSINTIDGHFILNYELIDYDILDTINKREFYNIEIKENNKFLDSLSKIGEAETKKNLKELNDLLPMSLKQKDFDSKNVNEFYYVIRYTYEDVLGTHNKTGYFDKNLKLESYYPK